MAADTFLQTQITETEAQITALNAAILFLSTNPHKSYQLDTGQSSQRVTREDLESLQRQVAMLLNRRSTLQARCGAGTVQIIPAY